MSTALILAISSIVGLFCFAFFFWKRLKEDYTSTQIFSVTFYGLIGAALGLLLGNFLLLPHLAKSAVFDPGGLWFWGALVGFTVGIAAGLRRFHMRFVETLEAAGIGILFLLLGVFISDAASSASWISLAVSLFLTLCLIAFFTLDKKYKSFGWYKSGRVGFAGAAVLGSLFLTRSVVAIVFPFVLSFIGKIDAIISSVIAFAFFFLVYNLSQE